MLPLFLKNTVIKSYKFIQFLKLCFSKQSSYVKRINQLTGIIPINNAIYEQAFYHSSLSSDVTINNERLEFLGDSILDSVVSEYIFKKYPKSTEGFLTKTRSKIVSRKSLGQVAESMGLNAFINHNNLNLKKGSTIYGNTLEALVGAIYIDAGYEKTRTFVFEKIIRPHVDLNELVNNDYNFKSKLVEWTQKNNAALEFKIVDEIERNNHKVFVANVLVDGTVIGSGTGRNKKTAENEAAEKAMIELEGES